MWDSKQLKFYNNQVIIIIIIYHIHFFPNTMDNEVAKEAIICEGVKEALESGQQKRSATSLGGEKNVMNCTQKMKLQK
jgi:hypothetical protein